MKTLDQRIAEAKAERDKHTEGTPEHSVAKARLEELEDLKKDGIVTQADANKIDAKAKEELTTYKAEVEKVIGAPLDEFAKDVETYKANLQSEGGEGGAGDDDPDKEGANLIKQLQGQVETLSTENADTKRTLYSERVENNLRRALSAVEPAELEGNRLSLKDGRFEYIRPIANDAELIDKLMKGEQLPDNIYAERAKAVYAALPEVFESPSSASSEEANGGDPAAKTVAGYKIKEETGPGIPETPTSGEGSELTAEERAKRATSVV